MARVAAMERGSTLKAKWAESRVESESESRVVEEERRGREEKRRNGLEEERIHFGKDDPGKERRRRRRRRGKRRGKRSWSVCLSFLQGSRKRIERKVTVSHDELGIPGPLFALIWFYSLLLSLYLFL